MKAANLTIDQPVDVEANSDVITIRAVVCSWRSLEELMAVTLSFERQLYWFDEDVCWT